MKFLPIFLLLFGFNSTQAQQTPLFEMPLYFMDSIGNKDTLILAYDPEASVIYTNEQFGEEPIKNIPFDSIFEVRTFKFFYTNSNFKDTKFYKKQVLLDEYYETLEGNTCHGAAGFAFMFNAKYLPVKMYYDRDLIYNQQCYPEAIFFMEITSHAFVGL